MIEAGAIRPNVRRFTVKRAALHVPGKPLQYIRNKAAFGAGLNVCRDCQFNR